MHQTQTPSSYQREEKHINLELKQFHPRSENQEIKYSMHLEEIMGFQVNPPQIHETGRGAGDRNWSCGRSTPIRVPAARSTYRGWFLRGRSWSRPRERKTSVRIEAAAEERAGGGGGSKNKEMAVEVRPRPVESLYFPESSIRYHLVMIGPVSASEPDLNPRRPENGN